MKPAVVRAKLSRRPFHPIELVLDNDEIIRLSSPEVVVAEDYLAASAPDGSLILVAPESISMIRNANAKRRGRTGRKD